MTNDALIEEINAAYRRLSTATQDLASADRELTEHVQRVRLDNAEAILEASRARAELDFQHARREVERLHLIVRLLGTRASEGIQG
jgi:outer membrane murein-binding lipoprotein Lpp